MSWLALAAAACVPGEHSAEHGAVHAEIQFIGADGQPLANEPGYILETLPFALVITELFKTDQEGRVVLTGVYCTPLVVVVDGGGIELRRDALNTKQVVAVGADRKPTKEAMYGTPKPGYTTLRRTKAYATCDYP